MTTTLPPIEEVNEEIRRIADLHHDTVYCPSTEGCNYFPDGHNPYGCIVGFAIRNLADANPAYHNADGTEFANVQPANKLMYGPQGAWAMAVQRRQDNGDSWSEAVAPADKEARK